MSLPPYDGLALFAAAAEVGSFAKGASRLGLTPSAISKAVSRLEQRLGVTLFRRTTRALDLTEEGRDLFERCRGPLADLVAAEEFIRTRLARPSGTIRISAPIVFAHRLIAPQLADFNALYPKVEIDLISTDQFSDFVRDRLDLLIRTGHLPDTGLVARKLLDSRFMTCAAPAYLARRGRPRSLEDLGGHTLLRFVFPETGRTFAWPFAANGETVRVLPRGPLAFGNGDAMIAAAETGAGLVHLQDYMLQPRVAAGTLEPVLEELAGDGGPVTALWLPTRQLSPAIRAFVDFLAHRLAVR